MIVGVFGSNGTKKPDFDVTNQNDRGELLAFKLIPANTDDRKPVPDLVHGIVGKLFGDKGYISRELFEQLFKQGLQIVTPFKKNMKNRLVPLMDKILMRKRALVETVNDQLKNIAQIELPWLN